MRDIPHQIDLIPSSMLLNKPAYRMSPKEDEELKKQVDDLLDKELVQGGEISYVVPTILVHEMDLGECVLIGKLSTTF